MSKKDELGNRMKDFYEDRTRNFLPRRTYTIIRVDGKSFHTYTKGLSRPFDSKLMDDMDETAAYMCKNIQGAKFAFVQSDEISLLLTDFESIVTDAWFDGNIQKIASVSASMATAKFNELRPGKIALFDSRAFIIPSSIEVENYFIWRQQDTVRNSISSMAQSMFSSKQLHKKTAKEMVEMCSERWNHWDSYTSKIKYGRLILKESYLKDEAVRTKWVSNGANLFTSERGTLSDLIPKQQRTQIQ